MRIRAYVAGLSWDGAGAAENLLHRPAAARSIGSGRGKAQRSDVAVTALRAPDWPRHTAAFLRGCASVRRLEPAEMAALPELLIARSLGSVLWRAARWRAGLGPFGEVTTQVGRLEATTRWLAANEDAFLSVAAAANAGACQRRE